MSHRKVPGPAIIVSLLAVLFVNIGVLVLPAPASAHVELESAEPTANARLDSAPTHVKLRFAQRLTVPSVEVAVIDRAKHSAVSASVQVDGATVTQPLRPNLVPEVYRVSYRVISDDGHAITSSYIFTVGDPHETKIVAKDNKDDALLTWWLIGGLMLVLVSGVVIVVGLRIRRVG